MTSREVSHVTNSIKGQENALLRLPAKFAPQPVRRGALGDLGNTIGNANIKPKILGAAVKGKISLDKKITIANKEDKENKHKQQEKPNKETETKISLKGRSEEPQILDPDVDSKTDLWMVNEYIEDIMSYTRSLEDDFPITAKFLDGAKVTPKMRTTLVNWLVEAHDNFNFNLECLHLCIVIVDRYLQETKSVTRNVFQLVGTAALYLAAKYEEISIPAVEDFIYICDDVFTKKQIFQMEIDICRRLDFKMGWPTAILFLRRYSKIASVKASQYSLSKYLLELALLEYNMAHVKPSIQAAAACCLSIAIINEVMDPMKVWTPTLMHYTKYKYPDFKEIIYEFAQLLVNAKTSKFDAVRNKYSQSKFSKISLNFKLEGPVVRKLTLLSAFK